MLCDKCKKREAKIYCTEIINGEKKEQYLCEECAAEYASFQLESAGMNKDVTLGGLLSSILGGYYKEQAAAVQVPDIKCTKCGMTYEEFLRGGKFGCAGCYQSFGRVLGKCFKQIQGMDSHAGKKPKGYVSHMDRVVKEMTDIERLSMKLQEAVEKEEFEEAVMLRDKIKELKKAGTEKEQEGIPNV